ncbi:hypothetical protein EYF80_021296 [Liparis tanakae]|uniref:Uncharacterized protein n=1 Tax=Liparis tanakae TaxID=230148 RepID=A0A4Z2HSH9_9TELE|nr:hypothetical protein EYF80_021296 [Liparis tanakae]
MIVPSTHWTSTKQQQQQQEEMEIDMDTLGGRSNRIKSSLAFATLALIPSTLSLDTTAISSSPLAPTVLSLAWPCSLSLKNSYGGTQTKTKELAVKASATLCGTSKHLAVLILALTNHCWKSLKAARNFCSNKRSLF